MHGMQEMLTRLCKGEAKCMGIRCKGCCERLNAENDEQVVVSNDIISYRGDHASKPRSLKLAARFYCIAFTPYLIEPPNSPSSIGQYTREST